MIIIKIRINWLILDNSWITIHLGKNPKKGGRPPKESKEVKNINFNRKEFIKVENNWFK